MLAVAPAINAQGADTTPPNVSLLDPPDGSTESGTCYVIFNSYDAGGLGKFQFFVDGKLMSTLTTSKNRAPYIFKWRTGSSGNGPHQYTVRVYDLAGNYATAVPFTVYVQN